MQKKILLIALACLLIGAGIAVVAEHVIKSLEVTVTVQEYTLTLNANTTTLFVGDKVQFSGALTLDATPVSGETVTLYYSNDTSTGLTDVTAGDGSYSMVWTAPYADTFTFYTQTTIT